MKYKYNNPPATDKEGMTNALKRAYNLLEDGDAREAQLQLADIIDTFLGKSSRFTYSPKGRKPTLPNPRGSMSEREWSRIVD